MKGFIELADERGFRYLINVNNINIIEPNRCTGCSLHMLGGSIFSFIEPYEIVKNIIEEAL